MPSLREWLIRLGGSVHASRSDKDLEEELRFHLDSATGDARRRSDGQEDAIRHARLSAGSISHSLELLRDQRGLPWLDDARRDLRQTLRIFARARGFTAVAVITLGLGIGAATAMFSVLNAVILRPLAYRDPGTLVVIWTDNVKRQLHETLVSYPLYVEWKERSRSFSDLGLTSPNTPVTLSGPGEAERLDAVRASASIFSILGVSPVEGRTYSPGEERTGEPVAVVSRALAERRFGSAAAALGQVLLLDGEPTTVIGVMPPSFGFPTRDVQLWLPLGERRGRMVVIGRLRNGTTLVQARQEMVGIGKQLAEAYPALAANLEFSGFETNLVPLDYHVTGYETRVALWTLLGAALLMMLIACTNVGTLLLARAAARQRELALKVALGATRGRLVRQMLIEAAALASASGVLGIASAFWILRVLVASAPPDVARMEAVAIDGFVLVFTSAVAVVCSFILGAITAWRAQNVGLDEALREGGRSLGAGARRRRLQQVLIVGELAVTLALLCGAGLVLRSLGEVRRLPLGFETTNTLLFRMVVPNDFSSQQRQRFFDESLNRIRRLPGVRTAGVVSNIFPISLPNATISVEAGVQGPRVHTPVMDDVASPGFFSALRVPLREGRYFRDGDSSDSSPVAIVNERFVREFLGGRQPIGKRFQFVDRRFGNQWITVVGVVGDMRRHRLEQAPYPQVFLPFAQSPSRGADIVIQADVPPLAVASSVVRTVAAIDASVPVYRMSTLEQRLDEFLTNRRFQVRLLSLFAGAAILLAAIGVYGLLRHDVTQRAQEIGVRMAMGASRRDVVALVLRNGLALTGAGLVIGWLAALALASVMGSLVYGISTRDPLTFLLAPLILFGIALIACVEPAWRALRVDPLRALRAD